MLGSWPLGLQRLSASIEAITVSLRSMLPGLLACNPIVERLTIDSTARTTTAQRETRMMMLFHTKQLDIHKKGPHPLCTPVRSCPCASLGFPYVRHAYLSTFCYASWLRSTTNRQLIMARLRPLSPSFRCFVIPSMMPTFLIKPIFNALAASPHPPSTKTRAVDVDIARHPISLYETLTRVNTCFFAVDTCSIGHHSPPDLSPRVSSSIASSNTDSVYASYVRARQFATLRPLYEAREMTISPPAA